MTCRPACLIIRLLFGFASDCVFVKLNQKITAAILSIRTFLTTGKPLMSSSGPMGWLCPILPGNIVCLFVCLRLGLWYRTLSQLSQLLQQHIVTCMWPNTYHCPSLTSACALPSIHHASSVQWDPKYCLAPIAHTSEYCFLQEWPAAQNWTGEVLAQRGHCKYLLHH